MALIYKATITPSKPEVVQAWLDRQPWAGSGPSETIGSYRFDDPDGEVGIEAMLVRRGDQVLQAVLSYRAAALEGADDHLIATVQHSVLGKRWVYDAVADPVAVGCFRRALDGHQEQAPMDVWQGEGTADPAAVERGEGIQRRDQTVRISTDAAAADSSPTDPVADGSAVRVGPADRPVVIARVVSAQLTGPARLIARWADGEAVVAAG